MNKYRDELVAIIKDMGQELIDRAEEMVAPDAKYIGDFNIDINIPNPREEAPSITYSTSTFCFNHNKRMYSMKYESSGTELDI